VDKSTLKRVVISGLLVLAMAVAALGGASLPGQQGSGVSSIRVAYADCNNQPPSPDLDCPEPTPTPTREPE